MNQAATIEPEVQTQGRFGTFGGVFTPCTLTILGVIMFLRLGQVVGNAGLWHSLLILLLAASITTITTLSLSSIATNTKIRSGGVYFLISRSLGVEFGGAIGLTYFLAQAIAIAMHVIGFTEALVNIFPSLKSYYRETGTVVNFFVFICVYIGAGWTIKLQYFILGVLMISVGAFVIGALPLYDVNTLNENLDPSYSNNESFLTMFALFFPAATGIMAGANMSGDLKDPVKSIPKGTLGAILFTTCIYALFIFLFVISSKREELLTDNFVISKVSISEACIIAGIFAATISSALGALMGAPRILQALAKDRIFKFLSPFSKTSGVDHEPRRAIILSFLIAQIGIFFGDLNAMAPIITMFFMITYGVLNFATFCESYSGNPSYRPKFKWCNWVVSLIGTILCFGTILLIEPLWAITAIIIMAVLYRHLSKQEIEATWSNVNSGTSFERVRRNLLLLENEKFHPKNWRPVILALGVSQDERLFLGFQGRLLAGRHGILILGRVIIGNSQEMLHKHREIARDIRKLISDKELEAFPSVIINPSLTEGISTLVQCSGLGALKPNLVLFGMNETAKTRNEFIQNIRVVNILGKSIALLKSEKEKDDPLEVPKGTIDVWWLGEKNGNLMVLLAHLLRSNPAWKNKKIRLLRMIENESAKEEATQHLNQLITAARIDAECSVYIHNDFKSMVQSISYQCALLILGMPDPEKDYFPAALENVQLMASPFPRVLFVHSNGDMTLKD